MFIYPFIKTCFPKLHLVTLLIMLSVRPMNALAADSGSQPAVSAEDCKKYPHTKATCGVWAIKEAGERKAIINFTHLTLKKQPANVLYTSHNIAHICVTQGHNAHSSERLMFEMCYKSDGSKSCPRRISLTGNSGLPAGSKGEKCFYFPVWSGWSLTTRITNYKKDDNAPGRSAKGTWALLR